VQHELSALIAGTQELRSLPSTTMKLMSLLDDPAVGAGDVLAVIEKDPSLTANLLKLCNSAYYGLRGRVGSMREALVLLGNQAIISLAFATSMGDVMRGPLGAYRLERDQLWRHALATAVGAAHLADRAGVPGLRERAFTGGLVHDIGKLLLNRPLQQKLQTLPPDARPGDLLQGERDLLGFDHATAGARLGEAWSFPRGLVHIIENHHDPLADPQGAADAGDPDALLTRSVAAANLTATHLGFGAGAAPLPLDDLLTTLGGLGFGAERAEALLERVPMDVAGIVGSLGARR
jgi:putative nucleotidyltransferase with HDIG domain